MSIKSFFYTNFILPYQANTGYTIYMNLAYGLILLFIAWLFYKLVNKKKIVLNESLIISSIPFFLFIVNLRVLEDAKVISSNFLTQSPGIYLLGAFLYSVLFFVLDKFYSKKRDKYFFGVSTVFWLVSFSFLRFNNLPAFFTTLAVFFSVTLLVYFFRKKIPAMNSKLNFIILSSHLLDASATFTTLDIFTDLNYFEQHPVTRLIGESLPGGYLWFILVKIVFVSLALYYLEKDVEDKNYLLILKMIVLVIGLAPGMRDLLRLTMGV